MSTAPGDVVLDASLRFARTNPELVALAERHARALGRSVDDLLRDAITRTAAAREVDPSAAIELPEGPQLSLVPGGTSRAS